MVEREANLKSAGPDLDALVAEKVCGWLIHDTCVGKKGTPPGGSCGPTYIPAYSTDLEAAMRLVEDIRHRFHCGIQMQTRIIGTGGSWEVLFYDNYQGYYVLKGREVCQAEGKTLPHAIALAALNVVGI